MAHDLQRRERALLLCEEGVGGREHVLDEEEEAAGPQHAPHLVRVRDRDRDRDRDRVREGLGEGQGLVSRFIN